MAGEERVQYICDQGVPWKVSFNEASSYIMYSVIFAHLTSVALPSDFSDRLVVLGKLKLFSEPAEHLAQAEVCTLHKTGPSRLLPSRSNIRLSIVVNLAETPEGGETWSYSCKSPRSGEMRQMA